MRIRRHLAPALLILLSALPMLSCSSLPVKLVSSWLGLSEPEYRTRVDRNVRIPMRDGTILSADLYRPRGRDKVPAILIRTPYGKRNPFYGYELQCELLASRGYAAIIQDVRGKYRSEGEFYPLAHEAADGQDTLRWIAGQSWCSGRIGMLGASYSGCAGWLAAAEAGDALVTIVPVFAAQSAYDTWLSNGAFNYELTFTWHHGNDLRKSRTVSNMEWKKGIWSLPLSSADDSIGRPNPIFDDWIAHPEPGPFWEAMSADGRVDRIRCSALLVAGWFDPFLDAMLKDFNRLRAAGGSEAARRSRLIIGPWTHLTESQFKDVDFSEEARFVGQLGSIIRWYDRWLKDGGAMEEAEREAEAGAPIRLFVMGLNRWRTEREWPLARTRYTPFYLHSGGWANSAQGDGLLSEVPPGEEMPDVYVYDPADPVRSRGGGVRFTTLAQPPVDQREAESRMDVLVYTSEVLEEDLEVTGPVKLVLYASSTAPDTDFTARLTDVYPDGSSIHLTAGIMRARYRDSLRNPSPLEPGRVYRYEIDLGATSNVFRRGHRIRLQVSSSDFPRYDRNPNTGEAIGVSVAMEKARQMVYHEEALPSHLILPVIPGPADPF